MSAKNTGDEYPDIAIIGMACLFPQAANLDTYWKNILGKVSAIDEPDPSWGADRYYVPDGDPNERVYTKSGGFLRDLYRFNPAEFGIMPSSIDGQEPDQFLALKVARDALLDAGYADSGYDHTNTGIVLGHSTYLNRAQGSMIQHGVVLDQTVELLAKLNPDMQEQELGEIRALLKSKLPKFVADTAPGAVPNVMTGRIANRLNLMGPNYLIDAACASSLLSVQASMEELRTGRSDLMLAGGVNASTPAEAFIIFSQLGGLSRSSRISPFGAQADGTLLGEGLGVVVLKRVKDAERDGDRIYGVVKSVGQSSDGRALGLLAPRLEGEVLAIERAYKQCDIDAGSISLIEAHGTGIPLGDQTEITALKSIMGERVGDVPRCAIGSVKSMISHCIPAAGIAGLIKTTLAMHYKILPPTLCDELNPALEMESTPFYVNTESRPWIHSPTRPRRAAVNAFGFGGINTHAVLEEYSNEEAPAARLQEWSHELIVMAAADRKALLARMAEVASFIDGSGEDTIRLVDVAWSLAQDCASGEHRLAIIATGLDDLVEKLRSAHKALQDESRHSYKSRKGILFSDQPLKGKLAFVFPGEGAQYPGMLADLAQCFPFVREWFDFWESIYEGQREHPTTSALFPPPTAMHEEARENLEQRLFSLEIGSESMFISTQAMFELCRKLGIEPDVMLGHSSGENSALVASDTVQLGDKAELRQHILRLNDMYQDMDASGQIVTGKLITVSAIPRDRVREVIRESGGELHLALDNCRNQSVLFGPWESTEKALDIFRKEGGLCAYLPFDRAYHTPLFESVSRNIDKFFEPVPFRKGKYQLYSCVNAGLYPTESNEEIRHHAAIQWSSTVRFTETVEKMYEDGVRFFVEVGPSGNLTAFVDDILQKNPHMAISANSRHRSGIFQLHWLLGNLFAQSQPLNLGALYEHRACETLDFSHAPPQAQKPAPLLQNTLPYISLESADIETIRTILKHREPTAPAIEHDAPVQSVAEETALSAGEPQFAAVETDHRENILRGHLDLMQEFLVTQAQVMGVAGGAPTQESQELPFIQRLIVQDELQAVAEFDLDVQSQRFIQDHILYSSVLSDLDPGLHALPVVPLAASLEMLAEVAALVAVSPHLIAMENVRAHNWIALDEGSKTVRLESRRKSDDEAGERIHAVVYEGDSPLIEGDVLFSDSPLGEEPVLPQLAEPKAPIWKDDELYTTGMFHGPLYHSVKHLIAWDESGIDAELYSTPVDHFFEQNSSPLFFINPVLLDAVGHLTAFWIAQSRGTDFSCFPSRIRRIELISPNDQMTEGFRMRGRLGFTDDGGQEARFLEGDYDCVSLDGRSVFRIFGWRDRFFNVPHSFYVGRTHPREAWYGEDWSDLYPELPDEYLVWNVPAFPPGFLEDAGAVWKRLLTFTLLSREERDEWHSLTPNPRRRSEWLLGRLALKDAARMWIAKHYGVKLFPADVVIRANKEGKPYIVPEYLESVGEPPQISLSHSGGYTIAVAGPPGSAVGVDIEVFGRVNLDQFILGAFNDAEKDYLASVPESGREEVALRLWCAKESAAKSTGLGLGGRPKLFEVRDFSADGLRTTVHTSEARIPVYLRRQGNAIIGLASGSSPLNGKG